MERTADREGSAWAPGIYDTRIYIAFRRGEAHGCFDAIFEGSVFKRHQDGPFGLEHHPWRWHHDRSEEGGRQPRLQAHKRSAKLAASMNAQDEYLLPFLMLPSPFFLPLLMCWQRGNVSMSNLQVLNAIPYVAEHGCKWRGLPKRFGRWHTIYTRMNHWSNSGVLDRVFIELQHAQIARVRIEAVSLDSTIVKVHPDGTGALKKTDPSTNWM